MDHSVVLPLAKVDTSDVLRGLMVLEGSLLMPGSSATSILMMMNISQPPTQEMGSACLR